MQDPFASVENMLLWQLQAVKKMANEMGAAFAKQVELYPLPKSTDGLPESWAFGRLTHQQVTLAHAFEGLGLVYHQIENVELALSNKDFPTAIYRIIQVNKSILSVSGKWSAAAAVRTYRYVEKGRKRQSIIAQKDRKQKPTKEELLEFKEKWVIETCYERGWLKAASRKFELSQNTIKDIIK